MGLASLILHSLLSKTCNTAWNGGCVWQEVPLPTAVWERRICGVYRMGSVGGEGLSVSALDEVVSYKGVAGRLRC